MQSFFYLLLSRLFLLCFAIAFFIAGIEAMNCKGMDPGYCTRWCQQFYFRSGECVGPPNNRICVCFNPAN